ncbi:MAG TPA: glyoxalase [Cyanobacteria bacterium UBA11149]|nr:glyoxalase [Cyanobacteria bacterium UBA11367]HBE58135.1 glyoxalase [Cyanobacteria bacterium UBA11366]HBK62913.1 glyoxalase [Cyanobacteria bacterium UBA11166]HBR75703.1 glyoxalase [Cyanobacteria bacterium UBA11159]HBS69776.1 glyoxalase [Cyanobacteria bacterium UBA11153]HBW88456.1 glyoxalase [Cyanobacteria bacterium UBA11149]HCA95522.1 glyoxalase [Cyanobacteria bacterium UBA9226]
MNSVLFHLAFPVSDIEKTKDYYSKGLGCEVGRQTHHAVILNLYDNQLVAHVTNEPLKPQKGIYPRHFGLIFTIESDWENLLERVRQKQLNFYQSPKVRFPGQITEHRTFFLQDPFYNLMEFKFYRHLEAIFGSCDVKAIGDAVE